MLRHVSPLDDSFAEDHAIFGPDSDGEAEAAGGDADGWDEALEAADQEDVDPKPEKRKNKRRIVDLPVHRWHGW